MPEKPMSVQEAKLGQNKTSKSVSANTMRLAIKKHAGAADQIKIDPIPGISSENVQGALEEVSASSVSESIAIAYAVAL